MSYLGFAVLIGAAIAAPEYTLRSDGERRVEEARRHGEDPLSLIQLSASNEKDKEHTVQSRTKHTSFSDEELSGDQGWKKLKTALTQIKANQPGWVARWAHPKEDEGHIIYGAGPNGWYPMSFVEAHTEAGMKAKALYMHDINLNNEVTQFARRIEEYTSANKVWGTVDPSEQIRFTDDSIGLGEKMIAEQTTHLERMGYETTVGVEDLLHNYDRSIMRAETDTLNLGTKTATLMIDLKSAQSALKRAAEKTTEDIGTIALQRDVILETQATAATELLDKQKALLEEAATRIPEANAGVAEDQGAWGDAWVAKLDGVSVTEATLEKGAGEVTALMTTHSGDMKTQEAALDKLNEASMSVEGSIQDSTAAAEDVDKADDASAEKMSEKYDADLSAEEAASDSAVSATESQENGAISQESDQAEGAVKAAAVKFNTEINSADEGLEQVEQSEKAAIEQADKKSKTAVKGLQKGMGALEASAARVAGEAETLGSAVDTLQPLFDASVEAVEDSGADAVDAVEKKGGDFAAEARRESKDAFKNAKDLQQTEYKEGVAETESAVNEALATAEESLRDNEAKVTDYADELATKNEEGNKQIAAEVAQTRTEYAGIKRVHEMMGKKWDSEDSTEDPKEKEFKDRVAEAAERVDLKRENVKETMQEDEKSIGLKYKETIDGVNGDIQDAKGAAMNAVTERYAKGKREVTSVRLTEPSKVESSVRIMDANIARMTSELIPRVQQQVQTLWDGAMSHVSKIKGASDATKAEMSEKLQHFINDAVTEARDIMLKARESQEPSFQENAQRIQSGEEEVDKIFNGLREKLSAAGGKISNALDDIEGKIKDGDDKVNDAKNNLANQVQQDKIALGQAQQDANAAVGESVSELKKLDAQGKAQIAGADSIIADSGGRTAAELKDAGAKTINEWAKSATGLVAGVEHEMAGEAKTDGEKASGIDVNGVATRLNNERAAAAEHEEHLAANSKITGAALNGLTGDRAAAHNQVEALINKLGDEVEEETGGLLTAAGETAGKTMNAASETIASDAQDAGSKMANASNRLDGTIGAFVDSTETQMDREQGRVGAFAKEMREDTSSTAVLDARIAEAVRAAQAAEAENDAKFSTAMSSTGQLFSMGLEKGKEAVGAVVSIMSGELQRMRAKIGAVGDAGDNAHKAAEKEISQLQAKMGETMSPASKALEDFKKKVTTFEQWEDQLQTDSTGFDQGAEKHFGAAEKVFSMKMSEKQEEILNRTQDMMVEGDAVFGKVEASAETLRQLKNRVGMQVNMTAMSVNAQEQSMDRKMNDMLELEAYQEKEAMDRVKKDMALLDKSIDSMGVWKTGADKSAKEWRNAVQNEFRKMGEEFDVSHLETEMANAEQKWAVAQAMKELAQHLGDDIHGMSSMAKSRLALLSQTAGAEIARLMADTTLSAEEKAKRIAKIKEDLRKRASAILGEDNGINMAQYAIGRNLGVATSDIENTMMRIAALQSTTRMKTRFSPEELARDMAKLAAVVKDAKGQIHEVEAYNKDLGFTEGDVQAYSLVQEKSLADDIDSNFAAASSDARALAAKQAEAFIEQFKKSNPAAGAFFEKAEKDRPIDEELEEDAAWKKMLLQE